MPSDGGELDDVTVNLIPALSTSNTSPAKLKSASAGIHMDIMGKHSNSQRACWNLSFPHVMVALCALCGLLNYADRVNMSVCIIALGKEYGLDVTQRSVVMSAFFWGYVPSQLMAALLCRRLGAKRVLAVGAAGWSLFTVLTPTAAEHGMYALVACRVAMGLTEGVAFPSMYHVFGEWVPSAVRGRAMALLHMGVGAGTTLALVLSPHIIRIYGWKAVFHIFGSAGLFWVTAWLIFARDAPRLPTVSTSPSSGNTTNINNSADTCAVVTPTEKRAVLFMLQNRACLALVSTQFLSGLFHYTLLSWLPTYFAVVFGLKATDVWFTFVPYLSSTIAAPFGGILSDYLAKRTRSRDLARKITTSLACSGAGVLVLAFSCARTVSSAVLAISCALGIFSLNAGGFDATYLDISEPQYAGLIKSVANTLGAASGAIAVSVAAMLLEWSSSWRFVFAMQANWVFAATAVFVKFGSSTTVLTDSRFQVGKREES